MYTSLAGKLAGKFMWGNQIFKVIHNAIDLTKFEFNRSLRDQIRDKLNISDDTFVIGHVGRFNKVKNQIIFVGNFS